MIGKICGTGAYAPPNVMKNDDLANLVETSDEWIRERRELPDAILHRKRI